MTIKEFIEENKGKYADICYESKDKGMGYSITDGFYPDMSADQRNEVFVKDVEECEQVQLNGCEFYLWIEEPYVDAWQYYDDDDEETKESVRQKALEKYDYSENDTFMVLFER